LPTDISKADFKNKKQNKDMEKFQTPKGTRDFLPEEMVRRQFVINKIERVFEKFGFEPFTTPAFEEFELLAAKSGEDVKKQIYDFEDKGGRRLGLRFDLTVPMARVVANNPQLQKPFKRYAIAPVWRYEEITATRKREFWQCDADVVGSSSMEADVECIAAAVECFKELGFKDFTILVNNRKVLDGFIEIVCAEKNKDLDIFRALDKLKKFGEEIVTTELKKIGLVDKQTEQLMKMIIANFAQGTEWLKANIVGREGINELVEMIKFTKIYGIDKMIKIDFSLARGLDYYTGPIFEIIIKGYAKYGSVAGGGRYDKLIETFGGRQTAATGISLGIERIIEIMEQEKMFKLEKSKTKVFVANVNEKVKNEAIKITQELRKEGINCLTDLMGRSLSKQLEYADNMQIPFVVIVGEKELKNKKVKIRNMKRKEEKEVPIKKIKENLK
jgi:histidyl-tRNA synthetase